MMTVPKLMIFLVDDDAVFLKLLESEMLRNPGFEIETYPTGEMCLANLSHQPDIIVLDYYLNGVDPDAMEGISVLDEILRFNPDIPVIMLSSQDKIEVAVNCMRHQAYDYVVKSETAFVRLEKIIYTLQGYKQMEKELNWYMDRM